MKFKKIFFFIIPVLIIAIPAQTTYTNITENNLKYILKKSENKSAITPKQKKLLQKQLKLYLRKCLDINEKKIIVKTLQDGLKKIKKIKNIVILCVQAQISYRTDLERGIPPKDAKGNTIKACRKLVREYKRKNNLKILAGINKTIKKIKHNFLENYFLEFQKHIREKLREKEKAQQRIRQRIKTRAQENGREREAPPDIPSVP